MSNKIFYKNYNQNKKYKIKTVNRLIIINNNNKKSKIKNQVLT